MPFISRLEQYKDAILDLYNKGMGCPEIVRTLDLAHTARSVERFIVKYRPLRTRAEALELSEDRRVRSIKDKWAEYRAYKKTPLNALKRFRILQRDGFRCQLCGATVGQGANIQVDHIIPVYQGGTNNEDNLQALCFECNYAKYRASNVQEIA